MKLFKLLTLIALIFTIKDSLQASYSSTFSLHLYDAPYKSSVSYKTASPCDEENLKELNKIAEKLNLLELNLTSITFKETPALSNFTTLQTLKITKSNITDCSSFSTLVNLTDLDLSYNPIKNINGLSCLTNLKFLDLDVTMVKDFSPLKSLTNLIARPNTQS